MSDVDNAETTTLREKFPFAFAVDDDQMDTVASILSGSEPRYVTLMGEARTWCQENVAPDKWDHDRDVIYLAQEIDAFAFKIRWG